MGALTNCNPSNNFDLEKNKSEIEGQSLLQAGAILGSRWGNYNRDSEVN